MSIESVAEQKSNGRHGKFGARTTSAPTGSLVTAASDDTAPEQFTEGLGVWGVTEDDVPGVREAWESIDRKTSVMSIDTESELVALFGDVPAYTRLEGQTESTVAVTVVWTGLDEDPCDEPDSEFMILEGERAQRYRQLRELEGRQSEARSVVEFQREVLGGRRPIWHARALAEGRDLPSLSYAHRWYVSRLFPDEEAEAVIAMVRDGVAPDLPEAQLGRIRFIHEGFKAGRVNSKHLTYTHAARVRETYQAAVAEHERLSGALNEAKALPDGPLKDFLIGERPEESYRVVEGKGRSKRTVTRTYRPTSELISEYERAERGFRNASKDHEALLHDVAVLEAATAEERDQFAQKDAQAAADTRAYVEAEWPGEIDDIPQRAYDNMNTELNR